MKAVILAAGEGRRMRPLTLKTPKPLVKINGKPIIDYVFESLPDGVDEAIVVIKYLGSKIKKHLGNKKGKIIIKYIKGSDMGSAYSFIATKKYLKEERFIFIYGDEIPNPADVENCCKKDLSILVFKTKEPQSKGIVYLRRDGTIKRIIEKPENPSSDLAADGIMLLNTDIFKYTPAVVKNEYYFSTMVNQFIKDHKVFAVRSKKFLGDITTPPDIKRAETEIKNLK